MDGYLTEMVTGYFYLTCLPVWESLYMYNMFRAQSYFAPHARDKISFHFSVCISPLMTLK